MFKDIHNHNVHTGVNHCRFIVERSFIVISLHSTLRTISNWGFDSRGQNAVAMQPEMGPLSDFRIPNTENYTFENTVVDIFGPFAIKSSNHLYPIFTPFRLTTRSLHLEQAYQIITDSFKRY